MEDREFLVCGFEGTWYLQYNTAQWLSWLERRPVTAEVESSSLFWVVSLGTCRGLFEAGVKLQPAGLARFFTSLAARLFHLGS